MGKVIKMQRETNPTATMPVEEWQWQDFKATWEALEVMYDADTAWRMIHEVWRLRAGEVES